MNFWDSRQWQYEPHLRNKQTTAWGKNNRTSNHSMHVCGNSNETAARWALLRCWSSRASSLLSTSTTGAAQTRRGKLVFRTNYEPWAWPCTIPVTLQIPTQPWPARHDLSVSLVALLLRPIRQSYWHLIFTFRSTGLGQRSHTAGYCSIVREGPTKAAKHCCPSSDPMSLNFNCPAGRQRGVRGGPRQWSGLRPGLRPKVVPLACTREN